MQNPRPRKYASDAERQAAFRSRASMVEFRADEKTAEKLTEIADTLDISRSDLLLSMVKFALTNHQWARFGLTHKTLPRYEENPIMATSKGALEKSIFFQKMVLKESKDPKQKERAKKAIEKLQAELDSLMERKTNPATKKFSPAQIAAQKLFAERARAGTLGKTVKRKANPATKTNPANMSVANTILAQLGGNRFTAMTGAKNFIGGSMFLGFEIGKNSSAANRVTITYSQARDLYSVTFLKAKRGGLDTVELKRFDNVYADQLRSVFTEYTGLETSLGTMGRKTNPDKAKPRAYVKRASQATGAPPSKRLVTRRKKALTAPAGYFPNPYTMGKSKKKANFPYCVETKATENWSTQSCFKTLAPAKEYAVALSKKYPKLAIRVMQYAGGAM